LNLPILAGFNAVPDFDREYDVWREIATKATPLFYQSLDYVGLDFFPDVFRPLPLNTIEDEIKAFPFHNTSLPRFVFLLTSMKKQSKSIHH